MSTQVCKLPPKIRSVYNLILCSMQLEKIINTYKRLTQIPALASAKLQSNAGVINSIWTQRNIERGKNSKFLQTCVLSLKNFDKITETLPLDISNE